MNVLVIAAHPDDEVLGCGGTVARLVEEGNQVFMAILGEGQTSRDCADQGQSKLDALRQASCEAASILGAHGVEHFSLPDNRLDTLPLLSLVKIVEKLIQKRQPDLILTHFHGDLNIDHQLVSKAVITATRPVPGSRVREVLLFSVASSTEWAFGLYAPGAYSPNVYYDVSGQWEKKLKALAAYDSEMRAFPHPRSAEAISADATRWGACIGAPYAEAFLLVRSVR